MAHRCPSAHYLNDRPRYILGRTIPEAVGLLLAAILGDLAVRLTGRLPFTGDLGKWHLLLIFIPPAAAIAVSFVCYADGTEPYTRQLVGYALRRIQDALWRLQGACVDAVRGWRTRVALSERPDEAVSS